jgi:predicted transcriptional regulator
MAAPIIFGSQRSKHEIVNDILQTVLSRSRSPSSYYKCRGLHISYQCNLSWNQLKGYLGPLIDSELLKTTRSGPDLYYEITDKGQKYLQVFAEIEDDLSPVSIAESVMDGIRPH